MSNVKAQEKPSAHLENVIKTLVLLVALLSNVVA